MQIPGKGTKCSENVAYLENCQSFMLAQLFLENIRQNAEDPVHPESLEFILPLWKVKDFKQRSTMKAFTFSEARSGYKGKGVAGRVKVEQEGFSLEAITQYIKKL